MAIYASDIFGGHSCHPRVVASTFSPWRQMNGARGNAPKQRSPWLDGRLLALSSILGSLGGFLKGQHERHQRPPCVCLASSRTELLVDGDVHSIEDIREAIRCLKEHCKQKVQTKIFTEPERCQNKKWRKFMREGGISFQPVNRRERSLSAEPNDEAIMNAMQTLQNDSIALLTSDDDFIGTAKDLQEKGANVIVLMPEGQIGTIEKYKAQGVQVLQLTYERPSSKVQAILHGDGTGSVELSSPYKAAPRDFNTTAHAAVNTFLNGLGYSDAGNSFLVQKCAKFWFANQLGSLTVYPSECAHLTLHQALPELEARKAGRNWEACSGKLAYFLPGAFKSKVSNTTLKTYGSIPGASVFKGGGPFILEDSSDLVLRALKRLGFVDDHFNADVPEAMFLFTNAKHNKMQLRQLGLLPSPGQSYLDVDRQLRMAFLSDAKAGHWQFKDKSPPVEVLKILRNSGILPPGPARGLSVRDTFEAMKSFVAWQKLPSMRTYNGLAWSILRYAINNKDPSRRRVADFKRWHELPWCHARRQKGCVLESWWIWA